MTMPSERIRALRWGGEFLQEMITHPSLRDDDRVMATTLLQIYPNAEVVRQWIAEGVAAIPAEAAAAIEATGQLLRSLQFGGRCPPELAQSLRFTLRHFPEVGQAVRWSDPHWLGPIHHWLLPENHYDR